MPFGEQSRPPNPPTDGREPGTPAAAALSESDDPDEDTPDADDDADATVTVAGGNEKGAAVAAVAEAVAAIGRAPPPLNRGGPPLGAPPTDGNGPGGSRAACPPAVAGVNTGGRHWASMGWPTLDDARKVRSSSVPSAGP